MLNNFKLIYFIRIIIILYTNIELTLYRPFTYYTSMYKIVILIVHQNKYQLLLFLYLKKLRQ